MKKKVVLVVAVLMMAITCMALLVGCVPNRPDRYLATWATSDKKAIVIGDSEYGISGDKMIMKLNDNNQTIYEKKGDTYYVYNCAGGAWSGSKMTVADAEKDKDFVKIQVNLENEDVQNAINKTSEAYEKNFAKDDEGWWKPTSAFGQVFSIPMKIEGNTLLMKMSAFGGAIETSGDLIKLKLNYKISVPSAARNAVK